MSAWDIAEGMLIRDFLPAAVVVGLFVLWLVGGMAYYTVGRWLRRRRRERP